MATYLDNLKTRRDAVATRLAAAQTSGGQSFNEVSTDLDGEKIDVDAHVDRLYRELEKLNALIAQQEGLWTSVSIAAPR